ncbi:hypothetical protein LY90DRAFT_670114 [Neocallimastix californiae]|uniref:Acyltransferase 3 domain-containing protein n=1 Tax=Neocallimastix californiae TaxID=1754190 RepID=A0A1Y2D4V7_9FUNG|nr:hypothetical protein LY90DRAFT_670114 [Neocallimastix californiae]|eukprot:ORY54349.1 hypothetical protein LY90DRAFT_670114 [Neocallimastix californiae]
MSDSEYQLLPLNNNEIDPNGSTQDLRPRKKNRLYWADCARIFSMFNIIFLHCANYTYEKNLRNSDNPNWKIACIYNSITRFSVPMFVLLSGTFFLDPSKPFSFKKLFRHNILRLFTAFYFWASVNAFINVYYNKNLTLFSKEGLKKFIRDFLVGEEYLWFILMIVGCYMVVPFLRFFSDDVVLARYFLGLFIVWGSLIPTLRNTFKVVGINNVYDDLGVWTSRWHYHFTIEFVGYFVAGYHLLKYVNIKSLIVRLLMYIFCVVDVITYVLLTLYVENRDKGYSEQYRNNFSIFVLIYAFILFLFFKFEIGRIQFSHKATKIITKLSSLTFGMYLSHLILRNMLNRISINQHSFLGIEFNTVIGIPIYFVSVSSVSLLLSYIISLIPVLNRYIV